MELVKKEDHWALYNEDGHKIAATIPGCNSKLSIKNCEAIELGYDLDELFESIPSSLTDIEKEKPILRAGFIVGFQKALEIQGDKKFSEEDMIMIFAYGHQIGMNNVLSIQSQNSPQPIPMIDSDKLRDEFIQSLQQTEWKVEIVTKPYTEVSEGFNLESKREPKLDANGCLILRRL